jgi:uncharacterized alpha-E superfamily protein
LEVQTVLSRVANSIYWMSRYIERAENYARFIDVNLLLHLDMPRPGDEQWAPMVAVTGDYAIFKERYGKATKENVIQFLAFDKDYANSILSCVCQARENARTIREIIPTEMWECVNSFYHLVRDAKPEQVMRAPHKFFNEVKTASQLFSGVTMVTMTHDEGWHFCRLSRLLERADKSSRILDVKYFLLLPSVNDVGTPLDFVQWSALLRSASAFEAYRKRYGGIVPEKVVEFLVLDREFPRAVHYCLIRAEDSLHAISGSSPGTFENTAEQECGRLRSELAYARVKDIFKNGVHEYLDNLQAKLNLVGDAIFDTFFALRPIEVAAAEFRWEHDQ